MRKVFRNSAWLAVVLAVTLAALSLAGCASNVSGAPSIRGISAQIVGASTVVTTSPTTTVPTTTTTATTTGTVTTGTATAGTTRPPTATQRVTGADVTVTVSLANFQIATATATAGTSAPGQGRLLYYLDNLPTSLMGMGMMPQPTSTTSTSEMFVVSSSTTYTWRNVSPGLHIFAVQLVGANNAPLATPVVAAVLLYVVIPTAATTTPTTTTTTVPTTTTTTTTTTPTTTTTTTGTTTTPTGTGGTTTPTTTTTAAPVTRSLVAQNNAFNVNTITVPRGAAVTVNLNNMDAGIPHNFSVYTNSTAQTPIFVGQATVGPATIAYQFTAPATPGSYFFRCDFHPQTMTGTFIVQ